MKTTRALFAAASFCLCLAAHAGPIVDLTQAVLKKADRDLAEIVKIPKANRSFENTMAAFDDISTRVDSETSLSIFMQNVSGDAKVREDALAAEEIVNNWSIDQGQREDLFRAFSELEARHLSLDQVQKRLLNFTLRDFRRAGMALPKAKRDKVAEIEKQLNKLEQDFGTNIAEDQTKLPLTTAELKGVPDDVLKRQLKFGDLIFVGLDYPTYDPVMGYCTVEATRQKLQWLYRRRGGQKNVRILEKILPLRAQEAELLSYKNPVDFYVETRMAKDSGTIKKFYDQLIPLLKKKADQDVAEFSAAKKQLSGDPKATMNPWDYAFVKNYLQKTKYAVDELKIAEYFPMQGVVDGLFHITELLYGVKMRDVTADASKLGLPIWHEDVRLYEFTDAKSGALIGHMYTDLYPRENKYNHAACWGLKVNHTTVDGKHQSPLVALVCNFSKGTSDKPSLLPHDEVVTFFHEFGHGLHGLFSQSKYGRFAGTGVARDFVEAPSQMMENWVWTPEVLKTFAKHYKTGEVIPDELVKSMVAARTLGSGIETEGQVYLGEMDQTYHLVPGGVVDTTKISQMVYERTMPYTWVPGTFPQASFGHLMGYKGAYYGYLWSLVYASDMFDRFKEIGVLSPETGAYYRSKILSRGGTMDEFEMLRDYLGREPKLDSFLKHLGLSD